MTKKFMLFLAIISIVVTMLGSCTATGVECGLIGKWETSSQSESTPKVRYVSTIEITNEDKIIFSPESSGEKSELKEYTIKSVDGHTITYTTVKYNDVNGVEEEAEIDYQNLTCDTVQFGSSKNNSWTQYKKVN